MRGRFAVPIACGLAALVIAGTGVTQALAAKGGDITALVGIMPSEPLAPVAAEHDAKFVYSTDHLDGAYFYAIAVDPLATGEEHDLVDVPAYRFGHPGYGWLAWLVAAGRPSAVPSSMLFIGLVCMFLAGAAASVLSSELGWSPWGGLVVALNPGLVFATFADNSEPLAMTVLILTLLAWMSERRGWACAGLVALCMIKEQFVLVPLALLMWDLAQVARDRVEPPPVREWIKRIALLAAGPIALGSWFVYLRSVYGEWPFQQHPLLLNPLTTPPFGYLDTVRRAAGLHAGSGDASQLGGAALPLLLVVGAALLIGIVRGIRFSSPVDPVFILLTVLMFSLTWVQLLYPKDLLRIAAVQLALLPAVVAGVRRPAEAAPDPPVMRT
ncbi:MAG TPA: hypothetical protein VIG64_03575 [Actinomycetota bacterium]|jgi:hypothetical protein